MEAQYQSRLDDVLSRCPGVSRERLIGAVDFAHAQWLRGQRKPSAIPPQAYGSALIVVGLLMVSPVTKIPFNDFTELIPAFTVVALMSFTYNIGIGVTAGFVLFPLCKLVAGRVREVKPGLWVLTGMSLLFFVFYPYT